MSTGDLLGGNISHGVNQLCYSPPPDLIDDQVQHFLIFMITGNPGLISYYEPFLSTLHNLLSSSSISRSARFHICGNSFAGFGTMESEIEKPVGLEVQIKHAEDLLSKQVNLHRKAAAVKNKPPKVILMGHSVGAYILLELISRHRQRVENKSEEDFDLIGGILLFPTITHLAQSPQGMIYSKILQLPYFPQIAGTVVSCLFYLVPTIILYSIIKLLMRYPDHAARTTADFIKSPAGVVHALDLAKDEMETINVDKWEKGVWEAATSRGTNSRDTANSNLILYWGENDKLVANKTRDDLIEARKFRSSHGMGSPRKDWKPSMVIDRDGIPHAFCLSELGIFLGASFPNAPLRSEHSESVAEKVKDWVEKIVEEHGRESLE